MDATEANEQRVRDFVLRMFRRGLVDVFARPVHVVRLPRERPLASPLARLQADYAWNDALTLRAGVLLYRSGEPFPFTALGANDRLFVGAVYRF